MNELRGTRPIENKHDKSIDIQAPEKKRSGTQWHVDDDDDDADNESAVRTEKYTARDKIRKIK